MKILYGPFAAKLPGSGGASPKNYPYSLQLSKLLTAAGHEVIQVGSNQDVRVADRVERGRSFKEVDEMLRECDTFIGVDSYLQHHAWLVGKRGIVIWGPSDHKIFGHDIHVNLSKEGFIRPRQFEMWTQCQANPEAFIKPEVVMFHVSRIQKELGG